MNDQEFQSKMQQLHIPDSGQINNPHLFKSALLNSRRSSAIGFIFIIIPCLFLLGVLFKYILGIDLHLFSNIENAMATMDKKPGIKWLSPFLLIGLPIIAIAINLLAITHFDWNRKRMELVITLKYKTKNIMVLLICLLIITIFFCYLISENMRAPN